MNSELLYSDEDISNMLLSGLREQILYNHPEMLKQLEDEAYDMMKGLTVPEMRKILARKIIRSEASLIELIKEHKEKKTTDVLCSFCQKTFDLKSLSKNEFVVSEECIDIICPYCGELVKIKY